jgi:amidase
MKVSLPFTSAPDYNVRFPSFAVKDSIDVAGHRTTLGSRAFADVPIAVQDAICVADLKRAGFHFAGKTVMHELAFGATGINDWQGTPINPLHPDRVPGGSSSGSAAAVASGAVALAIGTDTGGSVRVPAACCGVYGLKTGYGAVSRTGVMPATSTLDCIGFFARDPAVLNLAVSACIHEPMSSNITTAATIDTLFDDATLTDLSALLSAVHVNTSGAPSFDMTAAYDAGLAIINAECTSAFGHLIGQGLLGHDVEQRLIAVANTSDEDLVSARGVQAEFSQNIDALLSIVDCLILPTLAGPPPILDEARHAASGQALTLYARPFNVSGHPAISIPLGDSAASAIQVVGRFASESALCELACRIHRHTQVQHQKERS